MIAFQLFISYIIGSIPTSIIAGKWLKNIDIREHGSGNAGGTNSFRILGWKAGLIVSLIDIFKGYLAATFVAELFPKPEVLSFELVQILCGFAAVLGHIYTIFAGFRGGKGVATVAGMMFGLYVEAMSFALVIFIITLAISRYVSLSSILALSSVPFLLFFLSAKLPLELLIFSIIIAALIIFTHRDNIERLLSGTEDKIGKKKDAPKT